MPRLILFHRLILRPLRALKPDTGYAVILRDGLEAPGGTAHTASDAFKALRSGVPAAARTEELTDVVEWLGDAGIDLLEISGGTYEQPRLLGAAGRAEDAV